MKTQTHRETNGIPLNEQQQLLMAAQGKSSKTKHAADSQNRERRGETWDPSCDLKTHGQTHDLISFCIPPNEIMSDVTANQARVQVLAFFQVTYCSKKHISINQSEWALCWKVCQLTLFFVRGREEVSSLLREMVQSLLDWMREGIQFFFD